MKNERSTIPISVTIHDLTGEESKYKLDSHGFELVHHESKENKFEDDDAIKSEYFCECEDIYKRA